MTLRMHKAQWNMKGKKPAMKQFTCEDCGEDFWRVAQMAKFCDACRRERVLENKARQRERYVPYKSEGHRNDKNFKVTVECDPDPIAGFSAGARLSEYEVEQMLKLSCFTPGTVLWDETHQCRWQVAQEARGQRRIKLPAQAH